MSQFLLIWLGIVLSTVFLIMYFVPSRSQKKIITFLDDEYNEEVEKYIEKEPKSWIEKTKRDLELSYTGITIEVYLGLIGASCFFIYLLDLFVFQNLFVALLFTPFGFIVPRQFVKERRKRMIEQFDQQLIRPLDRMISVLIASKTPVQAVEEVVKAKDMPEMTRKEFERVLIESNHGISLDKSFFDMANRTGSESALFIASQISIWREQGNDFADTLTKIRNKIMARIQMKGEIMTITGEARSQINVIIILFIVINAISLLTQPTNAQFVFGSIGGRFILLFNIIMMVIGKLIANSMTV